MSAPIGLFAETSLAGPRDIGTYYRDLGRQIVLADQLGFDFFSVTQSYGLDYPDSTFSIMPDPMALFATQIPLTKQIKFLTGILIAPFHHPAMALSQFAALDVLSAGRVMLGLGRGHPWLYDRLGFNQGESRARFEEFCAMSQSILEAPDSRHDLAGRFWRTQDFQLLPNFVQARPPVFVAQVGGTPAIDIAVKHGFGMLVPSYLGVPIELVSEAVAYYLREFRTAWGREGEVLIGVQVYAHDDAATAIKIGSAALSRQLGVFARNLKQMVDQIGTQYSAYQALAKFFTHMSDEIVCRQTVLDEWPRYLAVWGDPASCLRQFETLFDRVGAHGLILNIDAGGMNPADVEAGMLLVGRDIVPELRSSVAARRVDQS